MKITMIGTGNAVPVKGRKCSCILVEAGENYYFVDMGTMAIDALRQRDIPVERVKGVFISHSHGDHSYGLIQFADLLSWKFLEADPVIFLPDMEIQDVLEHWMRIMINNTDRTLNYQPIRPGCIYDDGVLKVTAIKTQHCVNSHAFLLEAEGKRVLYASDLKHPHEDFPIPGDDVDLAICEGTHYDALAYEQILAQGWIKKLCITHYAPAKMDSIQALHEKFPLILATDDMEITM